MPDDTIVSPSIDWTRCGSVVRSDGLSAAKSARPLGDRRPVRGRNIVGRIEDHRAGRIMRHHRDRVAAGEGGIGIANDALGFVLAQGRVRTRTVRIVPRR